MKGDTVNDLISRQAAIEALKAMAVSRYKDPVCEDIWERDRTLDRAIDVMRGLPKAQSKPYIKGESMKFEITRGHDPILQEIGQTCRAFRESISRTQEEVAADVGLSDSQVSRFERGQTDSAKILWWYAVKMKERGETRCQESE